MLDKYCVVGAGPSGLATIKSFKEAGIPFDCFERESDIGGVWNFDSPSGCVYETTRMISSKRLTRFTDFPMPPDYPFFPSQRQAFAYLQAYAQHFELYDQIEFNTPIEHIKSLDKGWEILIKGEKKPRHYRGVVIASGHHRDPNMPNYPGRFSGDVLHSHNYKSPDQLRGKRILIVGAGNSGCDIAVDAINMGECIFHSLRRGYHFLPKYLFGRPIDVMMEHLENWPLPRFFRHRLYELGLSVLFGSAKSQGLPEPDHRLFQTHPTVNSVYPYYVNHGCITIKPDIQEFCETRVKFSDGSEEEIDLVIYATGYKVSFPFLNQKHVMKPDGGSKLYLNCFHPDRNDFFVVGLIQANGGFWQLAEYQAKLISRFVLANTLNPKQAKWFSKLKSQSSELDHEISYVKSQRHMLEVEYFSYRRRLKRLISRFKDVPAKHQNTTLSDEHSPSGQKIPQAQPAG